MRPTMLGVAALALVVAACVTVSQPAQLPTTAPSYATIPTLAPPPTASTVTSFAAPTIDTIATRTLPITAPSPPPSGVPTVVVTFDSGPDAGTYSVGGDPNCSYGVIDADTWAAAYGDMSAQQGQLSEVQVQYAPDTSGKAGKDFIISAFIVVGPVFGGTDYSLSLDRFTEGEHTAELDDQGSTAVIHLAGKSTKTPFGPGGVPIDLKISCPTVSRA